MPYVDYCSCLGILEHVASVNFDCLAIHVLIGGTAE